MPLIFVWLSILYISPCSVKLKKITSLTQSVKSWDVTGSHEAVSDRWFPFPVETRTLHFATTCRTALGSTQSFSARVSGALPSVIERPQREAVNLDPSSSEVSILAYVVVLSHRSFSAIISGYLCCIQLKSVLLQTFPKLMCN
jgi:hypothetical protein